MSTSTKMAKYASSDENAAYSSTSSTYGENENVANSLFSSNGKKSRLCHQRKSKINYNELEMFKRSGMITEDPSKSPVNLKLNHFHNETNERRSTLRRSDRKNSKSLGNSHKKIDRKGLIDGGYSSSPLPSTSSTSSSSSSDNDDALKTKYKIAPISFGNNFVDFDFVAGLDDCILKLKEMVTYPLLYPAFYEKIGISPPKGVLFHGPPGTGKTLVARALAKFCSSKEQKVAFYVRNGGDCLSKYIGEAERNIKLLFEDAQKNQPAIIFFDEIDAIAPARSVKNDQSHVSVVATLLAEMDGLCDRGQVVVIGATNRLQSLDPALRRPGRFDREFYFPLPGKDSRRKIIDSHTRLWELEGTIKDCLSDITQGYSGSDIKALCLEAATKAFNRKFSFIFNESLTSNVPDLTKEDLKVTIFDFMDAFKEIVPCSRRSDNVSFSLSKYSKILIGPYVADIVKRLSEILTKLPSKVFPSEGNSVRSLVESVDFGGFCIFKPRLLISGTSGMLTEFVAIQSLNFLENVFVQSLDILKLHSESATGQTAENEFIRCLNDAKRSSPSILFVPAIDGWWMKITETMRDLFVRFFNSLHPCDAVILIASTECNVRKLPSTILTLFGHTDEDVYKMPAIEVTAKKLYFVAILYNIRSFLPQRKLLTDDIIRLNSLFEVAIASLCQKHLINDATIFRMITDKITTYDFNDCDEFIKMFEVACFANSDHKQKSQLLVSEMTNYINEQDVKFLIKFIDRPKKKSSFVDVSGGGGGTLRSETTAQKSSGNTSNRSVDMNGDFLQALLDRTSGFSMECLEKLRISIERHCLIHKNRFSIDFIDLFLENENLNSK